MSRLKLDKSFELHAKSVELIPSQTMTMSKRAEAFAKGAYPIYLERGEGCWVWDVDGNKYLDYMSSLGPITLGYCYPEVNAAVMKQLEQASILSLPHPVELEAAQAVVDTVPCADMVRFMKTGAESTVAAARVARTYTGRDIIISCGYHGWLDIWSGLNPPPDDRGVPAKVKECAAGFKYGLYEGDDCLEAVLEKYKGQVAGIVTEATPFDQTDCRDYLLYMRELANKHGAVLVFDEIVTGYRMALGGAQEYFGVEPDLACFAKGISNGFPLSALAGKREIMKSMENTIISSTYGGDTISLAAAVASIKVYREKNVFPHIWDIGRKLVSALNALVEEVGISFEFVGYPIMSLYRFTYENQDLNNDLMTLLLQEMAERGVLWRRGGLLTINYSFSQKEIDFTLNAAREVFNIIKDAVENNDVSSRLRVGEVSMGIRRYTR